MDGTEPAAATNSAVFEENISRMCFECEPIGLTPRARSKSWPRVASFETHAMVLYVQVSEERGYGTEVGKRHVP
jgi:hypothetical protein